MPSQQELEQAIKALEKKIAKIKEKIADIDLEIKNTSVNNVERVETELAELKNCYYEIQARELLGDFDTKQKKEIEEKIQATEKKLKRDGDRLQNFIGIRQALESELKRNLSLVPQYQTALERSEFENLNQDREKLVEAIGLFFEQLEDLFVKVSDYNLHSVALATRILDRGYQLKGLPNVTKSDGARTEKVYQLAQPFDLNLIKNSLLETIAEIVSKNPTNPPLEKNPSHFEGLARLKTNPSKNPSI